MASLRARLPAWVIGDAIDQQLIQQQSDFVVLTAMGLETLKSDEAKALLEETHRVVRAIRTIVQSSPAKTSISPVELRAHNLYGRPPAEPKLNEALVEKAFWIIASSYQRWPWARGMNYDSQRQTIAQLTIDPERTLTADQELEEEAALSLDGPLRFTAQNFRVLAHLDWSPRGVCLLAGSNGSGKSTVLDVLRFLCDAFQAGVAKAVTQQRGGTALRRVTNEPDQELSFSLSIGPTTWELIVPVSGASLSEFPGEILRVGEKIHLRRSANTGTWYEGQERRPADPQGRTCLRVAADARPRRSWKNILDVLQTYRLYSSYVLEILRNGGTGGEDDKQLNRLGTNLFFVLRNWQTAPRKFNNQFAWVLDEVKKAFPGQIESMEFDTPVGNVIPARIFVPGLEESLPVHRAADGLLVGLLHLTAVAGAADRSIIAIDEMENHLHPHAIRSLLSSMRTLAEERSLTVILTTHSPVLMNEFRDHPDLFFVMEQNSPKVPIALSELKDPDWLAHFRLGELYDQLEFGAPKPT